MSALDQLESFGDIEAKRDFDPDLFIPPRSWARIRARSRPIVLGRKGTGKTTARLKLVDEAAKSHGSLCTTDLAFRNYPWQAHQSVFAKDVTGKTRYLEAWLFLVLVELGKSVLNAQNFSPVHVSGRLADGLRNFLTENWGSVDFKHDETFRQDHFKVRTGQSLDVLKVFGTKTEWETVTKQQLGRSLPNLNDWLRAILARLISRDVEYLVLFDELDLDFTRIDKDYTDSIIGLVLAAESVHEWARETGLRVGVIVFLRNDIYEELRFPDRTKLSGLVETIKWEPDPSARDSLKSVLERRIRVKLGVAPTQPAWSVVFDDQEMPRRQDKYQHMVARTYRRPRDLIQFANLCLEEAIARTSSEGGEARVTNADVAAARLLYSDYLRSELGDEIESHHPSWERWLELLRRIGRETFDRSRFDAECAGAPNLCVGAEPNDILRAFYEFSILGAGSIGGSSGGGTTVWRYTGGAPDLAIDAPFFKVHPGLNECLGLKQQRRRKVRE